MDGRPRETGDAGGDSERNPAEKSTQVGERVWGCATQWTQRIRGNNIIIIMAMLLR